MTAGPPPPLDVLAVDDEASVLEAVAEGLAEDGHRVCALADGEAAVAALARRPYDLIICDMRLPRLDGLGVFRHVRAFAPATDFVFVTAFGAVAEAVAALKDGAADYLAKPFRLEELRARVAQIARARALRRELAWARSTLAKSDAKTRPIGRAPAFVQAMGRVPTFADSDYPVLVLGESGTGKELVARMLHEQSARRERPLVTVNCAALPESLLEAELFGYRRGAFTGAVADREGRFRAAHGGTLFLDEVADLPPGAQAKLLRVLQEGAFEPLGSDRSVTVDVRLVSATHQPLREWVAAGRFREDLYYRLKVLTLEVPPLRERLGDIALLADHFLRALGHPDGIEGMQPEAKEALGAYPFRGNVRELEHAMQHASVLAGGRPIAASHLPAEMVPARPPAAARGADPPAPAASQGEAAAAIAPLAQAMAAFERQYLEQALRALPGGRQQAAEALGLSRKGLWQKLKRHDLQRKP